MVTRDRGAGERERQSGSAGTLLELKLGTAFVERRMLVGIVVYNLLVWPQPGIHKVPPGTR